MLAFRHLGFVNLVVSRWSLWNQLGGQNYNSHWTSIRPIVSSSPLPKGISPTWGSTKRKQQLLTALRNMANPEIEKILQPFRFAVKEQVTNSVSKNRNDAIGLIDFTRSRVKTEQCRLRNTCHFVERHWWSMTMMSSATPSLMDTCVFCRVQTEF